MTVVHCTYDPDTRSGTPGADARKVKGNIHWLSAAHAVPAEVRLYDRLFKVPFPGRAQPVGQRAATRRPPASPRRRTARWSRATTTTASTSAERNYLDDLNPDSKRVHPRVRRAGARRGGAAKSASSSSGTATSSPISPTTRRASPVFNRAVTLRDSWGKPAR